MRPFGAVISIDEARAIVDRLQREADALLEAGYDVEVELMALEMTVLRVLAQAHKAPGPEASVLKVRGTEIQQGLSELMMEAAGPMALAFDPAYLEGRTEHSVFDDDDAAPLAAHYFNFRKTSIYGGSNEIQRNIITQMILGL